MQTEMIDDACARTLHTTGQPSAQKFIRMIGTVLGEFAVDERVACSDAANAPKFAETRWPQWLKV